jgi:hypothetical protein
MGKAYSDWIEGGSRLTSTRMSKTRPSTHGGEEIHDKLSHRGLAWESSSSITQRQTAEPLSLDIVVATCELGVSCVCLGTYGVEESS